MTDQTLSPDSPTWDSDRPNTPETSGSGNNFDDKFSAIGQRRIGSINWLGVWTLYKKEVMRFLDVWMQTLIAPMVTTLLFFLIFSIAIGGGRGDVHGVPFVTFLAPGLIMMSVLQNAFQNTSSSIMMGKMQGCIVDTLMPPLSPGELTFAHAMGGATRGLVVAIATGAVLTYFADLRISHLWALLFFAFSAGLFQSLLGIIGAVWAEKWDHMAAIQNFVIMPLTFLSGTFYSIERLPEAFQIFSQFNPFFYAIDGFRYGIIGHADSNLMTGVILLTAMNIILWFIADRIFRKGWKLKA